MLRHGAIQISGGEKIYAVNEEMEHEDMEKAELSNITALGGTVQIRLLVAAGAADCR